MFWYILFAVVWIAIAFWPARVAARKGHSFFLYFLFSLVFFPLALLVAYMVDYRRLAPATRLAGSGFPARARINTACVEAAGVRGAATPAARCGVHPTSRPRKEQLTWHQKTHRGPAGSSLPASSS